MIATAFHFTYNGIDRWQLFFSTPNEAACFLACIAPLLWWCFDIAKSKWLKSASLLLEILIIFLIGRTFSRGGMLALFSGIAFFYFLNYKASKNTRHAIYKAIFTFSTAILIFIVIGAHRRLEPNILTSDRSVTNRYEIWGGALRMIASSPFTGWDDAGTGWAYAQWYRPSSNSAYANNLVSGLLDLGAGKGVLWLFLALFIPLFFLFLTCCTHFNKKASTTFTDNQISVLRMSCTALFIYTVTNIFSSFYTVFSLYIVPGLALSLSCFVAAKNCAKRLLLRSATSAMVVTTIGILSLYFSGLNLAHRDTHRISHRAGVTSFHTADGNNANGNVIFIPDPEVLGINYGFTLSQWLKRFGCDSGYQIFQPGLLPDFENVSEQDAVVLVGRFAELAPLVPRGRVIILNPIGRFPQYVGDMEHRVTVVVTPTFEAQKDTLKWLDWGLSTGTRCIRSPYGLDAELLLNSLSPSALGI